MKVVIFGANGKLGQALQQVMAYEDLYAFNKATINITSSIEAKPLLKEIKPQFLINCAAYTDVVNAEVEFYECRKINANPYDWIGPFCEKNDITLINISTNYVYGREDLRLNPNCMREGFDESIVARYPDTAYGKSKLLSETITKQHCKDYYIIRTSWLFGPGDTGYINRILSYSYPKLDVPFNEWSCPTYVFDLAHAIHALCRDALTTEKPPSGIYHLVNEGATTKANFVNKILELAQSNIEVIPVDVGKLINAVKRPTYGVLANTKRPKLRFWQTALHDCMTRMGYCREMK